jgi:hypothetical protein
MLHFKKTLVVLAMSTIFLGACTEEDNEPLPSFSLAISDAPVEALSEVVVCFNEIELKSSNGDAIYTVGEAGLIDANDVCVDENNNVLPNTVGVNLLDYTGSDSINLVQGISIEPGDYSQMRLIMSNGSYGIDTLTGNKIAIEVPSNELKLDGFTAALGDVIDFTLEFDLRKSMTNPVGKDNYFLKPRGVRLVDNNEVGHIEGSIAEALLANNQCDSLSNVENSSGSVYIYTGADLAIDTLADNGGLEENQALASTTITFNSETTSYDFAIGYVGAGDYTLAVSCDTEDNPEMDDDVIFFKAQNANVAAKTTTQVDFNVE